MTRRNDAPGRARPTKNARRLASVEFERTLNYLRAALETSFSGHLQRADDAERRTRIFARTFGVGELARLALAHGEIEIAAGILEFFQPGPQFYALVVQETEHAIRRATPS